MAILRTFFMALTLVFSCALGMFSAVPSALAAVDTYEFDTEEQQQRFRRMSNDFRCPMCQNTNLTGSGGGVAEDLRREIYLMIMDGKTDYEIEQFMLQRYGDFIFYKPRLMTNTLLLWFGPLIFLLIGAWVLFRILRRAEPGLEKKPDALDPAEQERLRRLLGK
jgi:cytochrome c-type biogenesis protein CcmH